MKLVLQKISFMIARNEVRSCSLKIKSRLINVDYFFSNDETLGILRGENVWLVLTIDGFRSKSSQPNFYLDCSDALIERLLSFEVETLLNDSLLNFHQETAHNISELNNHEEF